MLAMSNLETRLQKLKLKNPVILASGTFEKNITEKIDISRLGGIITKTITLKPRSGNPLPHIYKTEHGWLNSNGWKNCGLEKFVKEELPFWQKYQTQLIPSVGGFSIDEFVKITKELNKQNINALEINVSCPNLEKETNFGTDPKLLSSLVGKIRKSTDKTLIVKLAPDIFNILKIAKSALESGADILTIANTYPALEFAKGKPIFSRISAGYSGRAVKPLTMKLIWEVYKKLKCPIIASGGVESTQDVLDYLIVGARAVQIGSASFLNPVISVKIIDELERNKCH